MFLRPLSFSLALLLTTAPVFAQTAPTPPAVTPTTTPRETIEGTLSQERTVIGIPPLATASVQTVAGLRTDSLGRQIAEVIAADLERSGLYEPIGPNGVRAITRAGVQAPRFAAWPTRGAGKIGPAFATHGPDGHR